MYSRFTTACINRLQTCGPGGDKAWKKNSSSSTFLFAVSGCVETAYIFPGIGLGTIVSRATRLRDEAFLAAAEALAALVTDGRHPHPCPLSIFS